MEEGRINGNELKTELKKIYSDYQTSKEAVRARDKIAFAHYRISDLERIIEKNPSSSPTNQEETFRIENGKTQRLNSYQPSAINGGLPSTLKEPTASKSQTLEEAINHNNYQNNYNNNKRNNYHHQQQNRKEETFKTYTATNGYTGNRPLCKRCRLHHTGPCSVKCQNIMQISAQKQIIGPQESILRDKLAFIHFRISTLETTLEDIQVSSESSSI
ncbi:hypothetical protein Tco_1056150 [Tanacetum coccineum]|uniref:Uncharacterized protein n=1 Tax=Tanacetum coccineum TaxID=301880 RepID=A0ABQ5H1Q4_9ASTR